MIHFKKDEVALHDKEDDCWIILFNRVYDLTYFMKFHHSGGYAPICFAGTNATNMFMLIHPTYAIHILNDDMFNKKYFKGLLDEPVYSMEAYLDKNMDYIRMKEDMEAHVKSIQKPPRDDPVFHIHVFIVLFLFIVVYLLYLETGSIWFMLLLALIAILGALPIVHTSTHGGITKNKRLSNLYASLSCVMVGKSPYGWRFQHFRHHNDTMTADDYDITNNYPIIRYHPDQEHHYYHNYQHIYTPLLFPTVHLYHFIDSIKFTIIGKYQATYERICAVLILVLFLMLYIIIPGTMFGWKKAVLNFVVFSMIASVLATLLFTTNHHISKDNIVEDSTNLLSSQTQGSHNVCTSQGVKSILMNLFTGGLNHQIEHHLFPSYHYWLYPHMSDIVKSYASKYSESHKGLSCGFVEAQEHYIRHLKTMGTQNLFEINASTSILCTK